MSRRHPLRPIRAALVVAASLAVLPFTFIEWSDQAPPEPASLPMVGAPLPRSVEAGAVVELELSAASSTGTVDVLVISAAGSTRSTIDILDDRRFLLGPPHTLRAGMITLGLDFGAGPLFETIEVVAGTGGLLVDLNVGPTSIRRSEAAMAVGLLTDSWGNPVADGSPLRATITQGDTESEIVELSTRRGLAVLDITGDADSERFTIAMNAAAVFSPAIDVIVQSGAPLAFDLVRASDDPLLADARSIVELRSSGLIDSNGSVVADGAHVVLNVDGPGGPGSALGEVVDGVVRATLVAPAEPGSLTVTAEVRGRTSPALVLDFAPAALPFPISFEMSSGQRHVVVGPVIGPDGGLLPDGTTVTIGDHTAVLVDGRADAPMPPGGPMPRITVLGVPGEIS